MAVANINRYEHGTPRIALKCLRVVVRKDHPTTRSTTETLPQFQDRRERLALMRKHSIRSPDNTRVSPQPRKLVWIARQGYNDLRRRVRKKMKAKRLAIVAILVCAFALTSGMARADADDYWYQGHQGRWVQQEHDWRFRDMSGNEYRRHGRGWRWYNGRHHGPEGSAYHNRAPGDNRTYNQFEHQEGR